MSAALRDCRSRAKIIVNSLVVCLARPWPIGELSEDGKPKSQHKVVRSMPTYPRASWEGGKAFELAGGNDALNLLLNEQRFSECLLD